MADPEYHAKVIARTMELRREKYRWIAEYKAERGCSLCPEKRPAALDFHHRNSADKIVNISHAIQRWSDERILAEIEKCDVICANCHRVMHGPERARSFSVRDF